MNRVFLNFEGMAGILVISGAGNVTCMEEETELIAQVPRIHVESLESTSLLVNVH
jgi:hypothetical protein